MVLIRSQFAEVRNVHIWIKSLEDTVREAEARTPDIESLHATQTELHATKEELAALTELNSSLREAWETVSSELSDQTMSYEQASLDARDREYELEQKLREYGEVSSIQESELKSQIEDATTSERNARELAREAKRQNEAGFRRIAELESEIIQLKNSLVATPASPQADLQVKFETAQQELEQLQMQKNQIYNQMDAVRVDLGHKLQDIRQLKGSK